MIRHFIALVLAVFALNVFAAVDVNKASQAELETVRGIGPSLSSRILKARGSAAFRDWSDLVERVPGVGPASAVRLSKAGLTVGGKAYAGEAAPRPASKTAANAPK